MALETILCNLSDANSIIEEVKIEWINNTLVSLGVNQEILENANSIRQFRNNLLYELGIEVERTSDGLINIYKLSWHNDDNEELCG